MIKRPILLTAFLLVFVVSVLYRVYPRLFIPNLPFCDKERIILTGTVYRFEDKNDNVYIHLKNTFANRISDQKCSCVGKAVLIMQEEAFCRTDLKIGNTISTEAQFRVFSQARNYGNYDEEEYYHSEGVFLKAFTSEVEITDHYTDTAGQFLYELRSKMKTSINGSVNDPEIAGILISVCTGDRSGLSEETKDLYRKSGIAHILAISGLHISIVGMGIYRLLRKKLGFLPAAAISMIMVLGFCMMTGMSGSGIRAALMFAVSLVSIGLGKNYDILCSLSLAVILLVVSNPLYILHSGFRLSVLALFFTGYLYKPLELFFLSRPDRKCYRILKIPEKMLSFRVGSGLLLSLSVSVGTLPVIASMYYEIPPYSILINVLIIPVMSAILSIGLISAFSGMISLLAGRFFAGLGVFAAVFIMGICRFFKSFPGSSVVVGQPSGERSAVYYMLILLGVFLLNLHNRMLMDRSYSDRERNDTSRVLPAGSKRPDHIMIKKVIALLSGMAVILMVLFFRFPVRNMIITFLDVDQGECILIESPSGLVYMIDSGSSSLENAGRYRVVPAIRYKGISLVDYAIITHPDIDHISAVLEILENSETLNLKIANLLIPHVPDNEYYDRLMAAAAEYGVTVMDLYRGMQINDDALAFTCLHPAKDYQPDDGNGYSAVMEVEYGDFSALFTGDIGEAEEKLLISTGLPGNHYSLLKVAHHGSRFSSSSAFLDAVSPETAVISAGVNNVYGHPHQETLDRLSDIGASVFITAQSGEIIIEADEKGRMTITTRL